MSDERLTVHVWNELPELRRLADIVDAYFAERNLPEPMAFQFNLALDEILTNIISYGYLDQERHLIEIDLRREDGSLWVEIIDDGRGCNGQPGGTGLAGLAERAAALGGRLVAGPADAADQMHGFRLRVEVP